MAKRPLSNRPRVESRRRNPIVDQVRGRVTGYKKPKYVFVVDQLPRNSLGKVLKRELREIANDLIKRDLSIEAGKG